MSIEKFGLLNYTFGAMTIFVVGLFCDSGYPVLGIVVATGMGFCTGRWAMRIHKHFNDMEELRRGATRPE